MMYPWIWRHLPGSTAAKAAQAAVLIGIAASLLLFVVFPWLQPYLPFSEVTTGG